MATYVYETIPQSADEKPERFEIQQSMKDEALTAHPETGKPIKRVIVGGYGFTMGGNAPTPSSGGHSCGGGGCGCHN
ncbi:zinc ribbon domain-containing protein [Pelagicoccus sp. SDUM812005]|uniref:FmdB family zinc ribbon protein n=1 Tax=Pelagicoccus sp. SDUM812005 TaxID=3041257 RepID=UPI00280E5605|nr:zinc ribbon domain-containing protein [Pelagicoccus sp. SDUM812005]MDQ8183183.1 zinc ribbon domain-containing protein [Pelagicoccus sp. SDUM812005]